MSDPIFKINGEEIVYPANIDELSYQVNFDKDQSDVSVSINEWEFTIEHKEILDQWRKDFLFEGLPASIDIGGEGRITEILEFLLSVKDADPISCEGEVIPAIEAIDQLKRNREFTLEYLFEGVGYRHEDFVFIDIPYTKNAPQDVEIFLALLSAAFIIIEVENLVDELIDKIVNSSSFEWGEWIASIPFFIKAISVSIASIQIMEMLYQLLVQPVKFHKGMHLHKMLRVGYSFLGYDFKSSIFDTDPFDKVVILPKKRQVPESTDPSQNVILDILGIDLSVIKGFTQPDNDLQTAYYEETFAFLVDSLKDGMNLKEVIEEPETAGENPVIKLERRDYKNSEDRVDLDPVEIEEYSLNTDEFVSNYTVLFQVDQTDVNTIDRYYGTSFTEFVYPSNYSNKRNVLANGLVKKQLPFARGVRKLSLNKSEKVLDKLFKAAEPVVNEFVFQHNVKLRQAVTVATKIIDIVNDMITALDAITIGNIGQFQIGTPKAFDDIPFLTVPDLSSLIGNRVGMLQLQNDEFEIDKMILVNEDYSLSNSTTVTSDYLLAPQIFDLFNPDNLEELKGIQAVGESPRQNVLDERNAQIISAENFWNLLHSIESFVPNIDGVTDWTNGKHNQWKKYDAQKFNLCVDEFRKLKNSNFVTWCEKDGEFFSDLIYGPFTDIAEGKFKINEIYYDKLISKKIIANGSTRRG